MEVSTSLLVALMFVTILSMGIGNTVNTLSVIVEKGKKSGYSKLQVGWLVLLLISYFNMFWHIIDLLSVEKWGFLGFLYMMTGPILIYFATSILIATKNEDEGQKILIRPLFFVLFMLLQFWIITVDLILEKSVIEHGLLNIIMMFIAFVLIRKHDEKIQQYCLAVSLGIVVLAVILRSLGVLS